MLDQPALSHVRAISSFISATCRTKEMIFSPMKEKNDERGAFGMGASVCMDLGQRLHPQRFSNRWRLLTIHPVDRPKTHLLASTVTGHLRPDGGLTRC